MAYPRAGEHYPRSVGELQAWFSTDADCLDYLEWLRWPKGFVCPSCSHEDGWRLGDGRFMCCACGARTSVTAGTIFDRTPYATDGLVHRLLAVCHRQGRNLGLELEAHPGDRFVPDRMGDAASTPFGIGASRSRSVDRDRAGG